MSAVTEAPPAPPESEEAPDQHQPDEGPQDAAEESSTLFLAADYEVGKKVGGRTPDSSILKLKGKKIEMEGQFNRGDRLMSIVTLQVTGDNDQDTIDTLSGEVKSTSKAQSATLCGITRLEEYLRQKLDGRPELLDSVLKALDLGIEG